VAEWRVEFVLSGHNSGRYKPAMLRSRILFCLLLAFCLSACHGEKDCDQPKIVTAVAESEYIKTELYFGLSKPGGTVSASEWNKFLDENVTPAFKDGLTVVDGKGQWLNQAGAVTKEESKILILIHKPGPDKDAAIQKIIDTYKKQFQQESVMRVTSAVKVEF
jgi:hypothetical protein